MDSSPKASRQPRLADEMRRQLGQLFGIKNRPPLKWRSVSYAEHTDEYGRKHIYLII